MKKYPHASRQSPQRSGGTSQERWKANKSKNWKALKQNAGGLSDGKAGGYAEQSLLFQRWSYIVHDSPALCAELPFPSSLSPIRVVSKTATLAFWNGTSQHIVFL